MTSETTTEPTETPRWLRSFYAIPVIGWIARDLNEGDEDNVWYLVGGALCLWVLAILQWGVLGLYLPAVVATWVCLGMLIWISRG
ncbi:hypothetical protein DSD19_19875 [Rhodovulum sp. BSW8]|uniref:Uncharacterized protein n=1 Tax=Rhodovulum visakhapatnamense TaxID=364297 RepID=A0A4R8G5A1_9RHOB|nr:MULTISPECIES: hypothetical protein [Rhodovulum]OLS44025.1 hypothetical protein BV509_06485 [Rhodovulum sulfidophilum]MBL3569248.1 hypothetical protein [Rhodovulum visakhapatnamense]MBL3577474.1 hypothetical protein [Rhodovulum visakhapatnamense]RBO51376.1 hypothetical protein DSD19_19875 [Rhodovulum sp. BSW8]TDX31284.1 hypothetical protein EV657_105131 [Rhodovulum visakhapatnamense]